MLGNHGLTSFFSFNNRIRSGVLFRRVFHGSITLLSLLILSTICPLYFIPSSTEATTKNPSPSTLAFTATSTTVSVSVNANFENGFFVSSNTSGTNASFSLTTNNATGYTLNLRTSDNSTALSDGTNSIATISSATTSSNFANNTWGLMPSKYRNNNSTVINDTANPTYFPASTTGITMNQTACANSTTSCPDTEDTYTVGMGLKVDYSMPAGTYTNTVVIAEYVANPVTYAISYYSNTDDTVTDMPSVNPQTGTVSDPTTSTGSIVTTLAGAPVRDGYTFLGWCLGNSGSTDYTGTVFPTSTSNITIGTSGSADTCSTTTYDAGQSFGINTTSSSTDTYYLYAMWQETSTEESCNAGYICYRGNGATAGTMEDQAATSNTNTNLIPSNFSRPGYGFAGWNTSADGTGTNYGPGERINPGDLSSNGLILYAKWLAPSGVLQTWSGASSMSVGDVIALRDNRDNEVYTVAKLADNNVWITENLRLVPNTANITAKNTHNPTDNFLSALSSSSSSTTQCSADTPACNDHVYFYTGNMDRTKTQSPINNDYNYAWYSYGTMYNWYTATAGHGVNSKSSGSVDGDICPSGWHLPTGGSSGEYNTFTSTIGGTGSTGAINILKYPNNFIWSGDYNPSTQIPDGRGAQARIWSTTANSAAKSYRMGFNSSSITPAGTWNKWDNFAVRCIYQGGNTPYSLVTVDFEGTGITSLTFTSNNYDTETATPASPVIPLADNVSYTVTASAASGYGVTSWATTSNGTLGDSTANPAINPNTYTVTGEATLTVTGQAIPTYNVTVTLGEHVTSVSFSHANYGTINITPANSTDNGDGTYTGTATIYRGIEYTLSSSYENGYTIHEWTAGANSTIGSTTTAATTYSITGNTTLGITAEEGGEFTYTLVYNAGSGTDAPDSETVIVYTNTHTFTITNSAPIYYGYTFTGWSETAVDSTTCDNTNGNASCNGTTVDYVSGDTIIVATTGASTTKTFYPVYQAVSSCPSGKICYYENGADVIGGGRGTMANQSASSNTATNLIPTNYSKAGYGFAGWTTVTNANNVLTPDTTYGPNATITTPDLSSTGLALYAKWIKSTGDLQTWNGCNSLNTNDVIALTDTRDNETYAVAKLADDKCWVIENLRLVPNTANITSANTHNPASGFATAAASSASSNALCNTDGDTTCNNQLQYNTNSLNRSLAQSYNTAGNSVAWYSYGVYYNWYTATAGNGTISTTANTNVTGDICPAKWHLPTSTSTGEWAALNTAVNGGVSNADAGLRAYPVNLVWSGDYNGSSRTSGYSNGRYWSSTGFDSDNAYRMGHQESGSKGATPSGNYRKWDAFAVRCVYDGDIANPHDVVVTLPTGVDSITFTNPTYGAQTATAQNNTVSLAENAAYTITANLANGYEFTSWTAGSNSTIGSSSVNPTTLRITDDSTLTLTVSKATPLTIIYHGNGLTFNNNATTNTVDYYVEGENATRYSHTSNVNDAGTSNGNYPNDANTNDIITVPGATSLHITLTYQTESTSFDWVSFWAGSHPNYNAYDDYNSGIKCGGNTDGKYGDSTKTTIECDVSGDTVTFGFTSDGSVNEYYGYYAVITVNLRTFTVDSGTYSVPTTTSEQFFLGWSENQNDTNPTYVDEGDIEANSAYSNGDTVDLYAIYTLIYTVTVNLNSNVTSVAFTNANYPAQIVATNGGTVTLRRGVPYTITATFASGYILDTWSTTANGTLGSTTVNPTTYTITNTATLSVTSQDVAPPNCASSPALSTIAPGVTYMQDIDSSNYNTILSNMSSSISYKIKDSRDNQNYCVAKLADGKLWMTSNLNLAGGADLSADSTDVDASYISSFLSGNNLTKNYSYITLPYSSTTTFYTNNYAYVYNTRNITNDCTDPGCYSYYSWDAATLGSGRNISTDNTDAPYSICPKGWHLPTTRTGTDSSSDFRALMIALGGSESTQSYYSSTTPTGATMSTALQSSPSNFLFAGQYYNSSFRESEEYGRYWSATSSSSGSARNMSLGWNTVYSAATRERYAGYSVRCVANLPVYTVTVNLDSNTTGVTFTNVRYPAQTVTTNGGTVALRRGVPYTITATFASDYMFDTWSTTANGTLGSTTTNPTTYIVTDTATLSVTSQDITPPNCASSPALSTIAPGITYMQDINSSNYTTILSNMSTTISYKIKDSRDNQNYCVAKLADDQLWMTSNLNLAGGTAVSANDTDVDASYISSFTTSNNLTKDGSTIVLPASSTTGFDTNNYSYVYNTGNISDTCTASGCYSYYSWDAATLGSGRSISTHNVDAPYSICPKGWHLPTTRYGTDSSSDFRSLMIALGGSSSIATYSSSTTPTGTTISTALRGSPSNFLLAGYFYNNSFKSGNTYGGNYWSATVDSSSLAHNLELGSSSVYSADDMYRYFGNSVRCVANAPPRTVTVSLDSNTTSVTFTNADYPAQTVTTNGGTVTLRHGVPYTITATFISNYMLDTWSTTAKGALGSTTSNPTTYTVTNATTLSVTGQEAFPPNCISSLALSTIAPGVTYMQDINSSNYNTILSNMSTTISYKIKDSRDDQNYCVAKLADGKLWMTSNLNLAGGTAVSANDTDVDASYISSFTTSNNLTKDGSTIVLPASSTTGFDTNNYSYVYNTGNVTDSCFTPGCYSYYSWDAATLGSGRNISTNNTDAPYSICPKGWHLPTTRYGTDSFSDFRGLLVALGASSTDSPGNYGSGDVAAALSTALRSSPTHFIQASGYTDSSFGNTSWASYWSATSDGSQARNVDFTWNKVFFADYSSSNAGYSVRCVANLPTYTVTVNLDSNTTSVTFTNTGYPDQTVTTNGGTVTLRQGVPYAIYATFAPAYMLDTWTTTANGVLGSATTNTTTYTITGTATLSVTSQEALPPNCASSPTLSTIAPGVTYMQDINSSNYNTILSNMSTTISYKIKDSRDNQNYCVAKLADGKLWMTSNLNLAGGTAVSANDTDVDASYISSFTTSNNLTKDGSTIVLPASSTTGFNTNDYSYIYNTSIITNTCTAPGCYSYYSWDAATLGSGRSISTHNVDAPYSICPKGWHLPTTRHGADSSSDFKALVNALGGSKTVTTYNESTTPTGATISTALQGSPSNFLLAARSSFDSGYYWSATASGTRSSYSFTLDSSTVYTDFNNSNSRKSGFSVRCVANLPTYTVTVNLDSNTTGVTFTNTVYPNQTVSTNGGTVSLRHGVPYTITATFATGYELSSWSTTANGALGSSTTSPTTYIVTDTATLSVASQAIPTYVITVNFDNNTTGVTFTSADYPAQSVTTNGDTVTLRQGVSYTITASFAQDYRLDSWSTGSNGTLGSTTTNPTTYVVTDIATLFVVSKLPCETPVPGVTYMQDFSLFDLSSLTTNAAYYLRDKRDNTRYCVSKLADGNLWMLDNLALDLTTVSLATLKGNTNASDTTLTYLKNGGGTSPYTATAVADKRTNFVQYDAPNINTTNINSIPSGEPSGGQGYNKVGIRYNYCAASAGSYCYTSSNSSGNAAEDICPSGWRMPTGGNSGEYQTLYAAYSSGEDFINALSAHRTGYIYNYTVYLGNAGYYWSSTRYDNARMYSLLVANDGLIPSWDSSSRDEGYSVRCILDHLSVITVSFDPNVSSVVFSDGITTQTATSANPTVTLRHGVPYTITATFAAGYEFSSWSTTANGTLGSTTTNPTTYTITDTSTLSVISQAIPTYTVTVNLDNYTTSVTFTSTGYPDQTVTTNGGTVTLHHGVPYTITATFVDASYGLNAWSTTANGTLGSTTTNPTTYTVTDTATLSVTSQEAFPPNCASSPALSTIAPGITYMQDINSSNYTTILSNMSTTISYKIKDSRDNQNYCVAKLADDQLWMTSNLNLAGGTAVSANDTDVDASYISSFTTSNNLTKDGSTIVLPASSTTGFDTNNYSYVYNTGNISDTCTSATGGCYSYYSWDAATLGSGRNISTNNTDAPYSICPKGWHLPTTRTGTDSSSDFRALAIALGGSSSIASYTNATTPQGDAISTALQSSPSNFIFAGSYFEDAFNYGGSFGHYWSATSVSSLDAHFLNMQTYNVYLAEDGNRHRGNSVRCVFGS